MLEPIKYSDYRELQKYTDSFKEVIIDDVLYDNLLFVNFISNEPKRETSRLGIVQVSTSEYGQVSYCCFVWCIDTVIHKYNGKVERYSTNLNYNCKKEILVDFLKKNFPDELSWILFNREI